MKTAKFGQKILLELLKCNKKELRDIRRFLKKFKKRYGTDIFPYIINLFQEREIIGFPIDHVLDQIWYFLLTRVIKRYKTAYNMDYDYWDLVDLKVNYLNPEFRLKVTHLPYLMRSVKEAGLDLPMLLEIIGELNYFLKR